MTNINQLFKTRLKSKELKLKGVARDAEVSPGHLAKVLKGERKANDKIVLVIADVIDSDISFVNEQLSIAQQQYKTLKLKKDLSGDIAVENNFDVNPTTYESKSERKKLAIVSALILALILVGYVVLNEKMKSPYIKQMTMPSEKRMEPMIPGDKTTFIGDITIPDGTAIPVNTTFEKVWRVKNSGTVVWENRILKRVTPRSPDMCDSITQIEIPTTHPGETLDISIDFTTPSIPGSCKVYWKSFDENGNAHFPDSVPLFVLVYVVKD